MLMPWPGSKFQAKVRDYGYLPHALHHDIV